MEGSDRSIADAATVALVRGSGIDVKTLKECELLEIRGRLQQFVKMPPQERTRRLDLGITRQRCDDPIAHQLFDSFCRGQASAEAEQHFLDHLEQCKECRAAFVRLVWLSTN